LNRFVPLKEVKLIQTHLSPEDFRGVKSAAEKKGLPLATWLRMKIKEWLNS